MRRGARGPSLTTVDNIEKYLGMSHADAVELKQKISDYNTTGHLKPYADALKILRWANERSEMKPFAIVEMWREKSYDDFELIAAHLNSGDTYTPTLLYDGRRQRLLIIDWGTIAERLSDKALDETVVRERY